SLAAAGELVFAGGLVAVLAFSSPRPLATWNPRTHLLRLVDGLTALARLSSLFGDVLSYLRLFALGLASARLAATFNEIGVASWEAGGLGVVLALVVVLGGHTLNLLLSLMSGVVHGLRLNCIEFFNWSLPDEGSPFQPFAKKAVAG
ncbi:MAG: V-type ATP synthase subunit I, partial [Pirellulaceae bacterium]|nr:V-type ATP synthase subunit I [Pirellulaceae bacterium]